MATSTDYYYGDGGHNTITPVKTEEKEKEEPIAPIDNNWNNPFYDVQLGDWLYADVSYVTENGLFYGTNSNTFSPNLPMSRAMLVTVVGRLAGINPAGVSFDDVEANQCYRP